MVGVDYDRQLLLTGNLEIYEPIRAVCICGFRFFWKPNEEILQEILGIESQSVKDVRREILLDLADSDKGKYRK